MEFSVNVDPLIGGITLLMAAAIVWVGVQQISQLRNQLVEQLKASQQQLEASQQGMQTIIERSYAALLPQIDARLDAPELEESRRIQRDLLQEVAGECQDLTGQTKEREVCTRFVRRVLEWKDQGKPEYDIYMRRCHFFETVGFMCKKGYLAAEDIIELYGMPILLTYLLLQPHIADWQRQQGPGVFECFMELGERARRAYPTYEVQNVI